MPNILDANGLQVSTRAELVAYYTAQFQDIYGADVNLGSDTPDGQLMNIFIQQVLDLQDLLVQIYNTFDPDNAIGTILDQRVALNGIQRQEGTFTITPVTLVLAQSVNLFGLDQTAEDVYTVADNAGTQWQLVSTYLGIGPGTVVLDFRAALPGEQLTVPNTITVPVIVVLGVTSINNPTPYTTLGVNEESDAELKVRRQKSVSLASQGYLAGLLAALENTTGVTSAFVFENTTDLVDVDGVPGHSIWVIVAGTGADADIANAIYIKRNAGCGMFGETSYVITQVDGSPFAVYWDTVLTRNLFIEFFTESIDGITPPNIEGIRSGLAALFIPGVFEPVNINALSTAVQEIDGNTLVFDSGFSNGETQHIALSGVAASGVFRLNYNGLQTVDINWNDSAGTIQTKLQAVAGLSAATVTGSIASQLLNFNLSAVGGVLGLLTVSNNTLLTSGLVAVLPTYDEDYAILLEPTSKRNQFVVSSPNIIILPMQLQPLNSGVASAETVQFTGLGGYGINTYSFQANASGATIGALTGLYTAGAVPGTDVIKVTDAMGNTATATVVVA